MSKYTDLIKETKEQSGSSGYSRPTEVKLAQGFLNDPDYKRVQLRMQGGEVVKEESYPVKELRNSMKPIVKAFGVDSAEAEKLNDMEFNKAFASAFAEAANAHIMGYLKTGKSYVFNPEDERSTKMQISLREMPAKVVEPNKLVKDDAGNYSSVPTGDKIQYTDRTEIVATNKHLTTTKYKLK